MVSECYIIQGAFERDSGLRRGKEYCHISRSLKIKGSEAVDPSYF